MKDNITIIEDDGYDYYDYDYYYIFKIIIYIFIMRKREWERECVKQFIRIFLKNIYKYFF